MVAKWTHALNYRVARQMHFANVDDIGHLAWLRMVAETLPATGLDDRTQRVLSNPARTGHYCFVAVTFKHSRSEFITTTETAAVAALVSGQFA